MFVSVPHTPEEALAGVFASGLLDGVVKRHPRWTELVLSIVQQRKTHTAIASGEDLPTLRDHVENLIGLEPNLFLRQSLQEQGFTVYARSQEIILENVDVYICANTRTEDLVSLAARLPLGAIVLEDAAPDEKNLGWHPGRALEALGFQCLVKERFRMWQRISLERIDYTSLLVFAYRSVSLKTFEGVVNLLSTHDYNTWRVSIEGEAGIARARNMAVARWWRETAADVFLMLDDDIIFDWRDADKLVKLCREGYDLICGGYPVRDGTHMALHGFEGQIVAFNPEATPCEIKYASTGFLACHRRVIDALIPTLPLCHAGQPWGFWSLFDFEAIPEDNGYTWLSEDWNFSRKARNVGFKTYLDPTIRLRHTGSLDVDVDNMAAFSALVHPS